MDKCEEKILFDILLKFKKNELYDSNKHKIENTIQALKLAISIMQKECKKNTSCAKGREPKITDKGYECEEGMIIQKNRKGESCCYKDKRKINKKKTKKISSSSSSTKIQKSTKYKKYSKKNNNKDLQLTHIFSKNFNLNYIENIIITTKISETLGFLGRTIDVINFKDIEDNIDNLSEKLPTEYIKKWIKDKSEIRIYDTVTINNNKGNGQYLVYYNKDQLCLLKFMSDDGLVYPIEAIECLDKKINFYQEIYGYDKDYSVTKSIEFFLKGEIRDDYNFFLPITKEITEELKENAIIKIEKKLLEDEHFDFNGIYLTDTINSNINDKIEIIIADINNFKEYIPLKLTVNINNENFKELKDKLHLQFI